ncbi:MAG TPA: hypothetical protein PK228_18650 [Saprospiraceae bacterium]|nr:hypothetical protein [Saprospiraceae bacterium]
MIHQLLVVIETQLRLWFAGVIPSPGTRITAGSEVATPGLQDVPRIALYAGPLEISQAATDGVSSQVRPQALRKRIDVNSSTPTGPYPLTKTPLEGSLTCQIVYHEDTLNERRQLVVEHKDFTIDYTVPNLTFKSHIDLANATSLIVQYSFPGIFTVREFSQVFFMDIFDIKPDFLERWAAIATAMILTNHDFLLEAFNLPDPTKHQANDYLSAHTLRNIRLLEGTPGMAASPYKMQLKFATQGEIRLVKEISGGFGLIEQIHSPGASATPDRPVQVEPGLS